MIDSIAARAYRGVMKAAAGAVAVAGSLPAAPAAWRRAGDRLGRLPASARAAVAHRPVLWFHAASVGELRATRSLIAALRDRRPGHGILVTTLTRTGLALARDLPEVDAATLLPLDAPASVQALLADLTLGAFCFTETEIWPTTLTAVARRGAPAFMVSGRVGTRTAARARWLRPLYAPALAGVVCCMQSAEDATRVIGLGADPALVVVTGSLKFESLPADPPESVQVFGTALGDRPLVVAGSTHAGEEDVLLDAFARLSATRPRLALLLAPRHPERFEAVAGVVHGRGLPLVSYRALTLGAATLPETPVVILLDVMGPLAHCYGFAAAAFVGGSLVPVGGHNVIEPARMARPVLVGPYTATAADATGRIVAAGGGARVDSAEGVVATLGPLLDDREAARAMGQRAREAVASGDGALARHLAVIEPRLAQAPRAATG
jgi:3-deoxy-D-manno-octulosonic-acid transferase